MSAKFKSIHNSIRTETYKKGVNVQIYFAHSSYSGHRYCWHCKINVKLDYVYNANIVVYERFPFILIDL